MEQTLTKSQFCDQSLLTRSNKQKYLCALSRDVATEALMGQNGFDYLHGGSIMSNNKIMEEYAFSGQNIGIESVSHQYVHASDNETWLTDSYDLTPAAIYLAEKGEKIPKYAVNTLKKWLEDHIIDGEPIKKLNISETDSPQIKKTKTQYNKAVEKLKAKLKAEIKTESDISAYLEKLEFYHD